MKPIEIQNLDQHLKPLQVDGVSTGIELSTESLRFTAGTLEVGSDLDIIGNINMEGSGSRIFMDSGVYLESNTDAGHLNLWAKALVVNSVNYEDQKAAIYITPDSGYDAHITFMNSSSQKWTIGNDADDSDKFKIATGADFSGTASLTVSSTTLTGGGDIVAGDDIAVAATGQVNFDGIGGHTYIVENSDDSLRLVVGGDSVIQIQEQGDDGNQVYFGDSSVGFQQLEPTYDATNTIVDFRFSNKQFVTFDGGNIGNMAMFFPAMSGNFVLLLKQDGTGSRTVTNWKCYESDESAADGSLPAVWAGGSAPTLTTDANHVDILSFYWDADNEIAYGVATLDFQF